MRIWQKIGSSVLPRHVHDQAYAAVVLSGGYEEAGDHGRFRVEAGSVVLHDRFEAHINRFPNTGAEVLNLNVPLGCSLLPGMACVPDLDAIVRMAEQDRGEAAKLLLAETVMKEPRFLDWQDELAAAILDNPSISFSMWGDSRKLAPWTVSRGFAQVFGVPPSAFRARTRARQAWKLIQTSRDSMATIAADLGFADQSHMTRSVKRMTGMVPQAWRSSANGSKTTGTTAT